MARSNVLLRIRGATLQLAGYLVEDVADDALFLLWTYIACLDISARAL